MKLTNDQKNKIAIACGGVFYDLGGNVRPEFEYWLFPFVHGGPPVTNNYDGKVRIGGLDFDPTNNGQHILMCLEALVVKRAKAKGLRNIESAYCVLKDDIARIVEINAAFQDNFSFGNIICQTLLEILENEHKNNKNTY